MSLRLTSGAFNHGGRIPDKHSKQGGNVSPPLAWSGLPAATQSLALIVDDPDAPSGLFVHWVAYAIPPAVSELEQGLPNTPLLEDGMRQGRNGFGEIGWGGPQPPSGIHRYFFHLYALDRVLDLHPGASREELDRAIQDHILGESQLMGKFEHREGSRAA
jgi:Raf kinase inhibitor-like YbhB/YbcL family protein